MQNFKSQDEFEGKFHWHNLSPSGKYWDEKWNLGAQNPKLASVWDI